MRPRSIHTIGENNAAVRERRVTLKDDQILTIDELAALLKATKVQIYEIVRKRYARHHGFALRKFYVGKELRFLRSDVETWIMKCTDKNSGAKRRH